MKNLSETCTQLVAVMSCFAMASSLHTGWTANALEKACPKIDSVRICNPDFIINGLEECDTSGQDDLSSIVTALSELETMHLLKCDNDLISTEIQMAVVIVNNIDMNGNNQYNDEDYKLSEAKSLTVSLHDTWGVGNTQCNGSGIVLLLSIEDRIAYISISPGLTDILTSTRIDHIIDDMKPFLKDEEYTKAIVHAIHYIMEYVDEGPPSFAETHAYLLLFGAIYCATICFQILVEKRKTEYVKVKSHLDKIDNDRAMALMGKYECSSCPICLEDFIHVGIANDEKDIQNPPTSPTPSNNLETNIGAAIPYIGNDGKPLQLLRCGHAFDKSCWEEWISTPSSNIHQCPICKQDIGVSSSSIETRSPSCQSNEEGQLLDDDMNNIGNRPSISRQQQRQMYLSERNFRIHRLHHQYPNQILQTNVNRWTRDNYDGTMTQDNEFVVHNESSSTTLRNRGGGDSSFGGSCSGGGGGGAW
eukprot:scaffold10555_cov228-Chaetoceros_neogracile.AAC.4